MIRKWLIDIRLQKGLTAEQVALGVGVHRVYVTQIENGSRRPSVPVAKRYADFLGFNWTLFFEDNCSDTLQSPFSA